MPEAYDCLNEVPADLQEPTQKKKGFVKIKL